MLLMVYGIMLLSCTGLRDGGWGQVALCWGEKVNFSLESELGRRISSPWGETRNCCMLLLTILGVSCVLTCYVSGTWLSPGGAEGAEPGTELGLGREGRLGLPNGSNAAFFFFSRFRSEMLQNLKPGRLLVSLRDMPTV